MTLTEFLLARIAEDEAEAHMNKATARRMLAECGSKMRIIAHLPRVQDPDQEKPLSLSVVGERIARDMALPYADHPDYQQEWTP